MVEAELRFVGAGSSGEQTQRIEVSMQPDGCGSSLASTTAEGSAPGTEGASIVRPAWTPGIEIS